MAQNEPLYAGTIAENISFFDSYADLEDIYAAAKLARIHDDIMAMPMQYESLVGIMGSYEDIYDPVGDDDGDGVRNMDEEIVVTATPMTPEQSAAYSYHREVATWTVNAILYGLVAKAGASGFAGAVGAAAAVTNQAINDARQDMIDKNAHLNYLRDGADGSYDGRIDPRYITGEKVLPR